jgi:hypothetical protein
MNKQEKHEAMMSQTTYMVPLEGRHQRRARRFGTQQGRHHGERLHATDRGGREVDARCDLLGADGKGGGSGRLVKLARNLVRFGTVEISDGPQVIESKGQARSSVG